MVDTNLFDSGVIFERGGPFALLESRRAASFGVILSPRQRQEIEDVLNRSKFSG